MKPRSAMVLTLPSRTEIDVVTRKAMTGRAHQAGTPLFSEVLALFDEGVVELSSAGATIDVRTLPLADFHVLRAVLTKAGLLAEEEVAFECANCDGPMRVLPCRALEIGPWVDGEIDDPDLDTTLPVGVAQAVSPVPLGRVRVANTVTFAARSVAEAEPLFAAVGRSPFAIDAPFVEAMGVVALGSERERARIADALAAADDDAFGAVANAFLATHYPPRLACAAFCPACGARNDVDAPYERELEPDVGARSRAKGETSDSFPTFDAFADAAHAIATPMLGQVPGESVELVVEGDTPAVDDGGEPLLGSYVPPHPGDPMSPSRPPTVTVYYRTFRAMWEEDGPYDWHDELDETIEHELEHHVSFLRGEDPVDDAEREEIQREVVRVVGQKEASRRAFASFGASLADFWRLTWPLWLLALVALAVMLATSGGANGNR